MLNPAPLESRRFGLRTFRATVDHADAAQLFAQTAQANADLLILRVAPAASHAVRDLADFGLMPIHADTLVTYACALQEGEPATVVENGFSIDTARDDDREAIDDLVTTVFAEYPNHYTANPLLARGDIVAGYREWALSHLHGDNHIAWVARVGDRIAAIACSTFDQRTGECQGVLHGVHPDFGRAGIYTALIRYTRQHFRRMGCKRLTIQTQAWNMSVQRVWGREGFALAGVHETFHVNALLDAGHGVIDNVWLDFQQQTASQIRCTLLNATIDAASTRAADPSMVISSATLTTCRRNAFDGPHSLLVRGYDFPHRCGERILVGTLHDANGRIKAIVRVAAGSS